MRLSEIICEDVSPEASQKNIIDILTVQYPQLYQRLTAMAEKMFDNKGNLDSLGFLTGGQKSNWYNDVYFKALNPALYSFANKLPPNVRPQLTRFLSANVGGSFKAIDDELIPILANIAKNTKNAPLFSATQAATRAKAEYDAKCNELMSQADDDGDGYSDPPPPKEKSSIGSQNASVEAIISDVLSRIDKKQAGEIRNAIARSANKLQALQIELNRRGIKV